ncbi:hypothetical protein GCM10009828_045940 [Actinoplanes couchii]|uniref:RNA polymerase, sigma-24 subunit, ECF subfamily n=1 Tax=Actinoplanes couchii TaxID=403638 RepID=A0ABQ3X749_9ACTN|nr:hypothetical protein Aco03nite_026910 [Actinoplanes couchii]
MGVELTDTDFSALAEQHRRELHVHCYRMLGSFEDAEDTVQETFLRAWRRRETFEGRSTFRAWLYRIATNACLDLLAKVRPEPAVGGEVQWLQPYPDRLLDEQPEALAIARETIELAYVVAVQHLAPRPRAVLILRDLLGWPAKDVADLLGDSVNSVNSALQRARAGMREHLPTDRQNWPTTDPASTTGSGSAPTATVTGSGPTATGSGPTAAGSGLNAAGSGLNAAGSGPTAAGPTAATGSDATVGSASAAAGSGATGLGGTGLSALDPATRDLVRRFTDASVATDIPALTALLRHDVRASMPPTPGLHIGRDNVVKNWIDDGFEGMTGLQAIPTSVNRQPAVAFYHWRETEGAYLPLTLDVLRITAGKITEIHTFHSDRFAGLDLPARLPA